MPVTGATAAPTVSSQPTTMPATAMPTSAATTAPAISSTQAAPAAQTTAAAPTGNPIKIGASLSLSGDFSDDSKAFQQGYQLWADTVNKNGGLLGRPVQMDIVSDASSTD